MIINDLQFTASLSEILDELERQLIINDIHLLRKRKASGNDIMVQCPYHGNGQERKPSAGISMKDGTFHCFACGETHKLQEVISYCFGKDDITGSWGWNWLLKNFLTISVEERKDIVLDFSSLRHSRNDTNTVGRLSYVSEEELDSYRYTHPYMYKRKMTDEVIELFDIGYDEKTECITFPNRDINGNTLFIARRSVNTKFFQYPEEVEKPLYGLYEYTMVANKTLEWIASRGRGNGKTYALHKLDEVIICESMINAITCYVYGRYAVALNGTGTPYQYEQLRKMPNRKFILALDPDKAGLKGRIRLKKALTNKLLTEYIIPVGKDINDLSKEEFDSLEEVF